MWTPKRIILLVGWFAFFVGIYVGSSYLLGGIDGLPPLPDRFKPIRDITEQIEYPAQSEPRATKKLRLAFGDSSDEVKKQKFKLEIEPRGLALAAQDVTIEKDGRAKLVPFSVAIFSKDKGDNNGENKFPEITTIRADVAYLTFDRPLKNISQMADRKITDGEMSGNIRIINNRGTSSESDDVSLITQGILYYNDARHHIWTQDPVRILDLRTKPNPTTVDGVGADLYLLSEPPKTVASTSKKKDQSISGVDRVELRSSVRMDLWVDSQSGLLGPAHEDPKAAKPPAKPAPANTVADTQDSSSQVIIQTPGPFTYDFKSDKAIFEASKIAGPLPNLVTVDRLEEKTKMNDQLKVEEKTKMSDQLKCDLLEIQFARRAGPAAANTASATDKLEIETVRATGTQVVLTSDAEMLEAYGNEFTYNSKTLESVLKGRPFMNAIKEGNRICAPELKMINVKGKQKAEAIGEGTMSFLGNAGSKKLQEARWRDKLTYTKEGDKDQLILQGNAVFLDPEHEQELKGDTLKVYLAPADKGQNNAADNTQKRPTPTSVEAFGNVTAHSPDMNLEAEKSLLLLFRDVKPGSLPPVGGQQIAKNPGQEKAAEPGSKPQGAAVAPKPGNVTAAAEPDKKPRPIDVKARTVQAHVLRDGQRNEMQQVICTGNVHVVQAPEKPGENGVDIRGDILDLNHQPDGDILTVIGNNAQVQMDQLFILGPEINMDQTKNEVEVKGMGLMRMLSKQTFDGKALEKPTELRIEWEKRMFFDGTQASYFTNVGATQDTGRLNCEQMEVTLDHYVSLKQGGKGDQPTVEKMVCYNRVVVEDIKRDGKKVVEMKRINANSLDMDNDKKTKERSINASGPGWVRTYQLADKQDAFDAPAKKPDARPAAPKAPAKGKQGDDKEFKLTLISYEGRMWANNNLGIARFFDHVELIQIPTEDHELVIGSGKLPHGSLDMKCERMEVREEKQPNGTTAQELRAFDRVHVLGDNFSATCDVLKYDTLKQQLILESTIPGTYAKLYRQKYPGAQPDVHEARKIMYNRATGEFQAMESRGANIIN